jgi:ParB family chromosome partitioning protein
MELGHYFQRWEHEKVGKKAGGKVYIAITRAGEVETHEGWLTTREAHRQERGGQSIQDQPVQRPELTSALQAYVDIHRHAMVQAALVQHSGVALRLLLAHAVAGSWLWNVKADPLRAPTPAIAESHEHCVARTEFGDARMTAKALLGFEPDNTPLTGDRGANIAVLFQHLLTLTDEEVHSVLAIVMAETLAVGSSMVETAGIELAIDPLTCWTADDAFLTLLRQRAVLGALIGEVAGEAVATSNAHEKVKTLRGILGDCLAGTNGRPKIEPWAPRWLQFPATTYFASDDGEAGIGNGGGMRDTGDTASRTDDDIDAHEECDNDPDFQHDEMARVA